MYMANGFDWLRAMGRVGLAAVLAAGALGASAQTEPKELSLQGALQMAKQRNGGVRAAYFNYQVSRSRVTSAYGSFLPTLTPSVTRQNSRTVYQTGRLVGSSDDLTTTSGVTAAWRLLDSGTRLATLDQSRTARDAQELTSLDSLRSVLYDVVSKYYNALRAEELLRVQDQQVTRTAEILKQTEYRASEEVGDVPKKDVFQAKADAANAAVSQLVARNQVATSRADLKAVLGWQPDQPMPTLVKPAADVPAMVDYTLEQALADGLANRPDLNAARKQVETQKYGVRLAKIDAGVTYTIDAQYTKGFSPDVNEQSQLVMMATFPLYDGKRSGEAVRAQELSLKSQQASLEQTERTARADIESAYKAFAQNRERFAAAKVAMDAATENYNAALESQRLGAGTIIEVLTAQVSLATAESAYVEAVYDTLISEVQLRKVTGRTVPGETD